MMPVRAQETARFAARLSGEADVSGWRAAVRQGISHDIAPDRICWEIAGRPAELSLESRAELPAPLPAATVRINRAFRQEIETALLHSDPQRFALGYRLIWRYQREKKLHQNPVDADVLRVKELAKSVRRDIHKMHAFVRFRKTGEAAGREQFVAWFEPDHHIVEAVAPFFRNRFTGMDWVIVTPERSIGWDGTAISFGPGGRKSDVPAADAVETDWRQYYRSIFNPARVKIAAMKAEMPVKYWKNLPEAELIPELVAESGGRVVQMIAAGNDGSAQTDALNVADHPRAASLNQLYQWLAQSTPPSAGFASRPVTGEGPASADLMCVGEQPGDVEDREGRVFVGPAGQLLDDMLVAAGLDRSTLFLTNAVKRFKYVERGKRRIHQSPGHADIDHERWWVAEERRLVQPKLTLALGKSAARSLTGRSLSINRHRGEIITLADGGAAMITVHPSFLLRITDAAGRRIEREKFVRDLIKARDYVASAASLI